MDIGNVVEILKGTAFASQAEAIDKLLKEKGITTLDRLDNAPRVLGPKTAGMSTYQLVHLLREGTLNPPKRSGKKAIPAKDKEEESIVAEAEAEAPVHQEELE